MQTYFMTITNEIKFQILTLTDENHADRLMRQLGSFRLPILLYQQNQPGESLFNTYFELVFEDIPSLKRLYPHLIDAQRENGGDFLSLQYKGQIYDGYIGSIVWNNMTYRLFIMDLRVEYAQLLQHQEKYLLVDLVHKTSDFVALADENGNFVYINEAGLKLLGMAPDDVHILNVWDLHDHQELAQILEGGKQSDGSFSWVGHVKIRTYAGKWLFVSQSITSHTCEGKRYYASVMRDMSLLKRIEEQVAQATEKINQTVASRTEEIQELNIQLLHEIEASERMRYMLQEREQRLSTIIETTLDGFFRLDQQLHIARTNRAFKALIGAKFKELEGERIIRFIASSSKLEFKQITERVSKGERILADIEFQCLNGVTIMCSVSLNPYFVEGQGYQGMFGFIRPLNVNEMPDVGEFF